MNDQEEKYEKFITVSDKFIEIYKMFNVVKQVDLIKSLNRKELMLLLVLSIDSFSEDNLFVIENLREFETEMRLIYDLQQDKDCLDVDLLSLAKNTDEKYIDTSKIKDFNGRLLPTPLTEDEALHIRRDIGISNIIS